MTEQQFIQEHKNKKLPEIALLLSKQPDLDKYFIINQINGIQKAKNKLPEFYANPNILYPATISIEQCSSEQTAKYKSSLLRHSGLDPESHIIDLTGGFGIDSYYFSKFFKEVTYLEPNPELFDVVKQNFATLNIPNITLINSTCEDFLKTNTQKFDVAYIDPSRRNENQKVFMLADCIPNITELQHDIFKIAPKILVKTSPILDVKQSIKELKTVSEVWVVSVNNECKEVLYLLENKPTSNPKINTINLGNPLSRGEDFVHLPQADDYKIRGVLQEFNFDFKTEENTSVNYSEPLNYLYEPNTSILKAGAFKSVCKQFNVKKIAPNTHLYTSKNAIENFPGRTFKIEHLLPYQPKAFKKLGLKKANVSCRNFKDNVEQVKKKLNLKDGGDSYVFAATNSSEKPILILCVK